MKITDASATVFVVGELEKYLVIVRSTEEVSEELLNDLYGSLNNWYYSPAKFFVLNLPGSFDIEFQKMDKKNEQ